MSLNAVTLAPHHSHAFAPAAVDFSEQVTVTPCVRRDVGMIATEDHAFASRCAFSWRSERVKRVVEGRPITYETIRQTASFATEDGLCCALRAGDRIARPWDGTTFQITAVYRERQAIVCDLVVFGAHLQ